MWHRHIDRDGGTGGDPCMNFPSALDEAMKVPPVTVTLGPMGSLLRQLHSQQQNKGSLLRQLHSHGFGHLKEGVDGLCISFKKVSEADDPSFTAKLWMKEVREILYDTEDCINEVMHTRILGTLKMLLKTGNDLTLRVEDANEHRHTSLSLRLPPAVPESEAEAEAEAGASRLLDVDLDVESSMDKLPSKLLQALDDETHKELKVVPIYGVAGIGKTTAATTLYREFSTKFQCRAFLRVSRNQDTRSLLTSLRSQIKAPPTNAFADVPDLINSINEHLKHKRFLIIIDDLWTTSLWYIIRHAFPEDKCCSRIVTTTQKEDVALACCSYQQDIFMMRPLNDNQSRELFFKRLNCSEGECPTHLKDHLDEIIRKCGGLPLAIVTIASCLLANEAKPEPIQDLVSSIFRINSEEPLFASASNSEVVVSPRDFKKMELPVTSVSSEGIQQLINLIYSKLPAHLKTCLLYLSMYPEDYTINKDDLVKQCVTEDFIRAGETAGSYFDELVRIGMIQPVGTDHDGKVLSYKVGRLVLDFIRCRSMEENFITVLDYFQTTPEPYGKVRRLSIQSGSGKQAPIPASYKTSRIRSVMFYGLKKCVPSVVDYRLLRVLILDIWAEEDGIFDLTGIYKLVLLRYLKVKCNIVVQLPDKIGGLKFLETLQVVVQLPDKIGGLKFLETLQVPATTDSIPSDIGKLEKLLHLRLLIIKAANNLGRSKTHQTTSSLASLCGFPSSSSSSNDSTENLRKLRKLTNLQDLHLTCSTTAADCKLEEKMECLGLIVGELTNLKSVTLSSLVKGAGDAISCDDGWSWDSAPPNLERLELLPRVCIFPRLPNWLGGLLQLRILKVAVMKLLNEDIDILKGLPALTTLSLSVRTQVTEQIMFDKEGFLVLRYFKFICIQGPNIGFMEGAMPNVRKLKIGFNASRTPANVVVQSAAWFKHLTGLEEMTVKISGDGGADVSNAESVLVDAIREHPGSPRITVERVLDCEDEIREEDRSGTATQEENHQKGWKVSKGLGRLTGFILNLDGQRSKRKTE